MNYRAFEGTIVLESYDDKTIDRFDASKLYQRLRLEADSHDILICGDDALCFKKSVSVKGSHSKSSVEPLLAMRHVDSQALSQ